MHRWGHLLHRGALGAYFLWLGLLKVFGHESATSLIARTVYLGSPDAMVAFLGVWEALIGVCLIVRPLIRVALLLLLIRLPGTLLALLLKAEVCFVSFPLVPSIEGQHLIKDAFLITAAIAIGGTVREERSMRSVPPAWPR